MAPRWRAAWQTSSFNLRPMLGAADNVALPLRLAGRRPSRTQVAKAFAQVGIAGLGRHLTTATSTQTHGTRTVRNLIGSASTAAASPLTVAIVISAVAGSIGLLCGQIWRRIDERPRASQR